MFFKILTAFIAKGVGATAAFLMTIVVTKTLTIKDAGYFLLIFTIITVIATVNQFGTHNASLRYIGASHEEKEWSIIKGIANISKIIVFSLSTISAILLFSFADHISHYMFNDPYLEEILKKSGWIILFISISMLIGYHLQAISKTISSAFVLSIFIPTGITILGSMTKYSNALEAISWLQLVTFSNLILSLFLWLYFTPKTKTTYPKLSTLLRTCFPLWTTSIMATLTIWSSQFIAASWTSPEDIARLSVAQRTALLISFILITTNMVTAPKFAALYHQKKYKSLKKVAMQTTNLMIVFSTPVFLIIFIFSQEIMSLFGDEFESAGILLIILSFGQIINIITGSVGNLLTMTGFQKEMQYIVISSGTLTITLALLLTPQFGVIGAAIATSLGIAAQNIGAAIMVRRKLGFNVFLFWRWKDNL